MALRAKWTVRIDDLETRLQVAAPDGERRPEAMSVRLEINGLAPETPQGLSECLDYAPICDWITREWPRSDAAPLLETRVNELLSFLFACDRRVHEAWVGLYKMGRTQDTARVGVERRATRAQFQARGRAPRNR